MNVAVAPNRINTNENPRINAKDAQITFLNAPDVLFLISSSATPEKRERYPGTSGNTHGVKNDINPAKNAVRKETFSMILSL